MKETPGTSQIPTAQPLNLADLVSHAPGSIVSRALCQKPTGNLTLFAFDEGQGLSEHTAPFDAFVQILEGRADLVIGGQTVQAEAGEIVVMPAGIPHSLQAPIPFKMLLTMIRE